MNRLFAIVISAILTLPITVWAVDDATIGTKEPINIVNTTNENVLPTTTETEFKQPISKRKIGKKFISAMGGVAISSFAIFFLLTVYNRIRERYLLQVKTPEGEVSLETPDDLNGAVKTFLEKTKWG